jgi:hypothetical protein
MGTWVCSVACDNEEAPRCPTCKLSLDRERVWAKRYAEEWYCNICEDSMTPECSFCGKELEWRQREIR